MRILTMRCRRCDKKATKIMLRCLFGDDVPWCGDQDCLMRVDGSQYAHGRDEVYDWDADPARLRKDDRPSTGPIDTMTT